MLQIKINNYNSIIVYSQNILSESTQQGGNVSDLTIMDKNGDYIGFSIKYHSTISKKDTDISILDSEMRGNIKSGKYKIGLIVKSIDAIKKSKKMDNHSKQYEEICKNNLLFDEKDIIRGMNIFCERFRNNQLNINDFIESINTNYLMCVRVQLIPYLHQHMWLMMFIQLVNKNINNVAMLAWDPRSGKSIAILLACKYLLKNRLINKILIMSSVPSTFDSFISDMNSYIDFQHIEYKTQDMFDSIERDFCGIVFCSVQFLKTGEEKQEHLKRIGFGAIFIDESHLGSSTEKTRKEILEVSNDEILDDIRRNIGLNIFSSGTPDKTIQKFHIPHHNISRWEMQDKSYMKKLNIQPSMKKDITQYMISRHGEHFKSCIDNATLNHDYTKYPTQVLIKHTIPEDLIEQINEYNTKNNTHFGYCCSSLFALRQITNEKGEVVYAKEFELCKTNAGIEILKEFFDVIISSQRCRVTIMTQIEITQTSRSSRKSTKEHPLLFIIYLPTHTRNNIISTLQETLVNFLQTHGLWSDYNIEYSNSTNDSGVGKEEYNDFIKTIMKRTRDNDKKACILFLGDKGGVGITYKDCDVTISLDDGHNLDNQKQRNSRSMTEAEGKTIGINVDMNIQRTYSLLSDIIHRHRKSMKTSMNNAEILYYLYENNIFLFNPQEFHNGKCKTVKIHSYYEKVSSEIIEYTDDEHLLEKIECDDLLKDYIKTDFYKKYDVSQQQRINKDLEGEQQHCPKGDKTSYEIDPPDIKKIDENEDKDGSEDKPNVELEMLINQTYEMCKGFLVPLLALISKSHKIFNFKNILREKKELMIKIMKDKKIDIKDEINYLIIIDIMDRILDNNDEIIHQIREIYSKASSFALRRLIEKHFIPTIQEKKKNAEVPTPVSLVDDMLDKMPIDFWKTPHKVFEPCCGKGNFVLGIFDRFYKGLEELYPDNIERCRIIMTECIYYADLTALNVFITTEIMKCHVQSYCGLDELDFEFNNYTGNTLEIDVYSIWKINNFDAVIGNPPYQPPSNDKKGGTSIWNEFVSLSLSKLLKEGGYLVFVHPALWRKPDNKLRDEMFSKQIHYLSIHNKVEGNKLFGATTRFDYYLLENTPTYKNTRVIFEDKKEYDILITKELPFIPNFGWSLFDKVFKKLNNNGIMTIGDSDCHTSRPYVSKIKTNEYKYELLNSISKTKGKTFCYSSRPHKVQNNKKVLFSNGETIVPFYDNGELGITQGGLYTIVNDENEGKKLVEYLNSNLIVYLIKATKWSNFETCKQLFWYIPLPTDIHNVNNPNVNTYFDLTQEEIITISK